MAENVLEKIIEKKSEKIVNLKKTISLEALNELINTNKTFIDFKGKNQNNLKESKLSIIADNTKARIQTIQSSVFLLFVLIKLLIVENPSK